MIVLLGNYPTQGQLGDISCLQCDAKTKLFRHEMLRISGLVTQLSLYVFVNNSFDLLEDLLLKKAI